MRNLLSQITLWGLGLLLLVGCEASTTATAPSPVAAETETNQLVVTDTFEGVIFSQKNAAEGQMIYRAEEYWTPTQADILALEQELGPYLQQTDLPADRGPLKPLTTYKRQYVGFIKEGKPLIFTNFFCDPLGQNWQEEFFFISDGGSCYFEITYDPETGTFSSLSIHGEA